MLRLFAMRLGEVLHSTGISYSDSPNKNVRERKINTLWDRHPNILYKIS